MQPGEFEWFRCFRSGFSRGAAGERSWLVGEWRDPSAMGGNSRLQSAGWFRYLEANDRRYRASGLSWRSERAIHPCGPISNGVARDCSTVIGFQNSVYKSLMEKLIKLGKGGSRLIVDAGRKCRKPPNNLQ